MRRQEYPVLEFDPARKAIIEPSEVFKPIDISEHCVVCFHKDVVEQVAATCGATMVFEDKGVYGSNPYYQFEHNGQPVVFFFPLMGASISAAFLELTIALGCKKFIVCGGAGVLDRDIPVGAFVVLDGAIRDEGTSYQYIEAGREILADPEVVKIITTALDERGEPYQVGKSWTTDGLFRETPARIAARKKEGCLTVEMEAAALFAVAQFRQVRLGYIVHGGDDVSGEQWDRRLGEPRAPIKDRLFWLSVEACLRM
ncbi:MAG: nucleoside phosphorylase [Candidatus Zixiibacteriota bacterium]